GFGRYFHRNWIGGTRGAARRDPRLDRSYTRFYPESRASDFRDSCPYARVDDESDDGALGVPALSWRANSRGQCHHTFSATKGDFVAASFCAGLGTPYGTAPRWCWPGLRHSSCGRYFGSGEHALHPRRTSRARKVAQPGSPVMKHIATWIEKDHGKHFDELFVGSDFRLWNALVEEVPWDDVGGLLLTGGSDISAECLHQPVADPAVIRKPDADRDLWDFS